MTTACAWAPSDRVPRQAAAMAASGQRLAPRRWREVRAVEVVIEAPGVWLWAMIEGRTRPVLAARRGKRAPRDGQSGVAGEKYKRRAIERRRRDARRARRASGRGWPAHRP